MFETNFALSVAVLSGSSLTPVGALLGSELAGLAFDFPSNTQAVRVGGIDTTNVATSFIDFTRASNATVTDSDGKVKWAPHNLLLASESFDSASWTKVTATVTANSAVAPNGTLTADTFSADGSANWHYLVSTASAGHARTASFFVKKQTNDFVQILFSGDPNPWANFDVATGVVGSVGTDQTASITSVGSGWYLCTVTTPSLTAGNVYISLVASASAGRATGGAYSTGVYLWGAHLYRSDLGGMQANTSAYPMYNPTTPKNLLGYTEDFRNAAWTNAAPDTPTVTSNNLVAPNGITTGDTLTAATGGIASQARQSINITGAMPCTFSVYIKQGTSTQSRILVRDQTNGLNFLQTTGLTWSSGVPVIAPGIGTWATPVSAGNGWWRIAGTGTAGAGATVNVLVSIYPDNSAGTGSLGVWGAQLSDSASLDAYSPVYGAAVTSAAYYGPRRDFDGATLACKGLLVEEQRANLLVQSAVFNNASWTKTDVTIAAAAVSSPDGATNADTATPTSATPIVRQTYTTSTAGAYVATVWMRSASSTNVTLSLRPTGAGSPVSVVCAVTSAWQRFTVNLTAASGVTNIQFWIEQFSQAIYLWGAQLEAGSFATSYIPTGAATATRNADVASVSTQAFPYSATEGTLVASGTRFSTAAANQVIAELGDGGATNIFELYRVSGNANGALYVASGGAGSTITISNAFPLDTVSKMGGVYKASDFQAAANGTLGTPVTSGAVPTAASNLYIGRYGGGSNNTWNGHIRQITYIPRRISNADLTARTA